MRATGPERLVLSRERSRLVRRLHRSRTRSREGLVLVEGVRAVGEALGSDLWVRFAACSKVVTRTPDGQQVVEGLEMRGVSIHWVEGDELRAHSATEHPQGVLLVAEEPAHSLEGATAGPDARVLVADEVRDPGNLGTLIRTAYAFGLAAVVALDGTVDPWSTKVVRASAGTALRIPLVRAGWEEVESWAEDRGARIIVADASGADVAEAGAAPPWAFVAGGEARGARASVRTAAHAFVSVPMPGGAESLNVAVAGGILMYVLARGPGAAPGPAATETP